MIRFFLLKQQQMAAGFALFGGGFNGAAVLSNTSKYSYTSTVWQPGTSLGTARSSLACCSNNQKGIFIGGDTTNSGATSNVTEIYQFSSNVVTAISGLFQRRHHAACGNQDFGIFIGGRTTTSARTEGIKYAMSTDTSIASSLLPSGQESAAAAGNTQFGIFAGGFATNITYKYTYTSDAVASSTSLIAAKYSHAAFGTSAFGIFAGGATPPFYVAVNTSFKYTYSTDAVSSTTSLIANREGVRGAGNSSVAILLGGTGGNYITELYNLSNDAVSTGTSATSGGLATPAGSCSSTPGHL